LTAEDLLEDFSEEVELFFSCLYEILVKPEYSPTIKQAGAMYLRKFLSIKLELHLIPLNARIGFTQQIFGVLI
jgi:hypothetical protein